MTKQIKAFVEANKIVSEQGNWADEAWDELAKKEALAETQEPIGEMKENGVTWYKQNPHAYPVGTKFYITQPTLETRIKELEARLRFQDEWLSNGVYYTTDEAFKLHDEYNTKIAELTARIEKDREYALSIKKNLERLWGLDK